MKWFSNIKIRTKFFIVFGLLACIIISFALFSVMQVNTISNDIIELIDKHLVRQILITEAITDVYRMRFSSLSRGYLGYSDDFNNVIALIQEDYESNAATFIDSLYKFADLVCDDPMYSDEEKHIRLAMVDEIEISFNHYLVIARRIEEAINDMDLDEAIWLINEAIVSGNSLNYLMQNLRDILFFSSGEKILETTGKTAHRISLLLLISGLVVFMSVFALLFILQNISQPISKLKKAATEIAKGNRSFPIRSDRKDELGILSNQIGDMVDKMNEALNAEKIASEAKSAFLTNMSHEIRTPMNAILGIAEIQLQKNNLSKEMQEALFKIYSAGDLLLGIINDILDLSKIESGKIEIIPSQYEIASLINDTVTLNTMRIGNKEIDFELFVDENIPAALFGDQLRIKQILNNLLSNAFKYTEKGKVKLSATSIADKYTGITIVFEVSDTGQGMTEEQIKQVFDEYSRFNLEENRTIEGAGLGMSITQNLAHLMGGQIFIKSELNIGSVFTVHLPQGDIGSKSIGKDVAQQLQNFRISKTDLKNIQMIRKIFEPMPYGSVLIVDDVESNLYVAAGLLEPFSLKIETVTSGIAAVDKIKEGKVYDIIFMDHMMPKMDGIEAVNIIRSMGYQHPIIALTANAVAGQMGIFLTKGFDGLVSKPIDVRQLSGVLKKYIRDKQPLEVIEAALRKQTVDVSALSTQLIEYFLIDVHNTLAALESINLNELNNNENDLRIIIVNIHGMKSALANVNEKELSEYTALLEKAAREGNIDFIKIELPEFIKKLKEISVKLMPEDEENNEICIIDKEYLRKKLISIKNACENYEKLSAKEDLGELRSCDWPKTIKLQLDKMASNLLNGDFEELTRIIDFLMKMHLS